MARYRFLILNSVLLLAVAGSWWGRRTEGAAVPAGDFLQSLQLPFRGWRATEVPLTPRERELLRPDSVLIRNYQGRGGAWAQLAVIAGQRKETVHTPAFCMAGGGWELLRERAEMLALPGRSLPVVRAVMARQGQQVLLTYLFTDGDYATGSLVAFQAAQLLKRFRSQRPMGALVRVLVPFSGDEAAARALSDEFARATLPPVLASLRSVPMRQGGEAGRVALHGPAGRSISPQRARSAGGTENERPVPRTPEG